MFLSCMWKDIWKDAFTWNEAFVWRTSLRNCSFFVNSHIGSKYMKCLNSELSSCGTKRWLIKYVFQRGLPPEIFWSFPIRVKYSLARGMATPAECFSLRIVNWEKVFQELFSFTYVLTSEGFKMSNFFPWMDANGSTDPFLIPAVLKACLVAFLGNMRS